jgi:Family of unknown function (DUF6519)/Chaperone of endosialidase
MKGDFTRSTFKAEKHYNGVRMQQGRLQLDADWNEQVDIQNHINQSLTQDLIGDSGAAKAGGGFEISIKTEGTDKDLTIAAGHIYVNGILCELEEPTTYTTQLDYPNPNPPKLDKLENGSYLAYLDVWERHITAIEDQKILEPALKGLDTATRTKTIWQVKLISTPQDLSEGKIEEWIKTWKSPDGGSLNQDSKGYLTAATADGISPNEEKNLINRNKKNYRGSENQLYRVEIHTSGDINTAKFKWSQNNGTTVSAIDSIKGNSINLVNIGRDDLQSFKVNQWVEILDEEQELKNDPGILLRLQKAFNTQLDVVGNPVESQFSGKKKLKVRGWHDTEKNEIPVSANWLELENGIYIKFDENSNYKTGDYWLIPARAVTKDIDWNYDESGERKKERSHGIQHHYSPLALVKYQDNKFTEVKDYRQTFPPLKNVLDKTGDIMTGDLEIQANLYVTRKLVNSEFIPGKVGIGTKTPFQQLIINSGKVGIGYNEANQTAGLAIRDNVGIGTFDPKQQLIINSGKVGIGYNEANQTAGLAIRDNVGIGTFDPKQQLIINSGKVAIGYNEANQTAGLAIRDNVGIGTFDPSALLEIQCATKNASANSFLVKNPEKSLFAIKDDGKVGIGIDNPEQKLVINNGKVGIGYNDSNQTATLAIKENVGIGTIQPNALLNIKAPTKDGQITSFLVQNPESSLFAIKDDGKVGIGTIQPNALLDIKTATKDGIMSSFLVQNPDRALLAVKDDGKVGIGIFQPKAKLEIKGVIPSFGTGEIKSDRANKITGIQTQFQQELRIGDTITVGTQPRIITDIDDDNSLTVNAAFDPDLPSNGTTFTYELPILRLLDSDDKTQMIVTNSGNVSIGNAFPNTNAKLFVDGDLRVNGKLLQNSSRELKENITKLSSQEALETLNLLEPVKFTYKDSSDPKIHVGFISQDVPDLLASSDKTSVSPVDIAAVLTKAVKDQQVTISLLVHALKEHQKQISTLLEKVRVLESRNQ